MRNDRADENIIMNIVSKRILSALLVTIIVGFVVGGAVFLLGSFATAPIKGENEILAEVWVRILASLFSIVTAIIAFVRTWHS